MGYRVMSRVGCRRRGREGVAQLVEDHAAEDRGDHQRVVEPARGRAPEQQEQESRMQEQVDPRDPADLPGGEHEG